MLTRRREEAGGTFGTLEAPGFDCLTLEPDPPVIPLGKHNLWFGRSPRFKRLMWHVENVPGHSGILIHNGNCVVYRDKDGKFKPTTTGCILVGLKPYFDHTVSLPGISHSRLTLSRLHEYLSKCQVAELEIISYVEE